MSGTPRRSYRRCRRCPMVACARPCPPGCGRRRPLSSPRLSLLSFLTLLRSRSRTWLRSLRAPIPAPFSATTTSRNGCAISRCGGRRRHTALAHPTSSLLCWQPSRAARPPQDRPGPVRTRLPRRPRTRLPSGEPRHLSRLSRRLNPLRLLDMSWSLIVKRHLLSQHRPRRSRRTLQRGAAIVTYGRRCCWSSSSSESSPLPSGHSSRTASSALACRRQDGKDV
jgi:hypothetical protein